MSNIQIKDGDSNVYPVIEGLKTFSKSDLSGVTTTNGTLQSIEIRGCYNDEFAMVKYLVLLKGCTTRPTITVSSGIPEDLPWISMTGDITLYRSGATSTGATDPSTFQKKSGAIATIGVRNQIGQMPTGEGFLYLVGTVFAD